MCLISMATFKYLIRQLNQTNISPVQYKSTIYAGGNSFDDYYGGEIIKEKFAEVIDYLHNSDKY
jgi:ATP-dependent Zn protease